MTADITQVLYLPEEDAETESAQGVNKSQEYTTLSHTRTWMLITSTLMATYLNVLSHKRFGDV